MYHEASLSSGSPRDTSAVNDSSQSYQYKLISETAIAPNPCMAAKRQASKEAANNFYQLPLPTIPNLDFHDLEIFNHYAAYTSSSLSDRDSVQLTWRVAVAKEAIPHNFLMHALLGFASTHLAQLCPVQRNAYGAEAVKHRNLALRSCIPDLRNITPTNCHALFAFSSLIAISTFVFPNSMNESPVVPIENILSFFILIRGVNTVLQGGLDWIRSGSLEPLIQDGRLNWRHDFPLLPAAFHAPFESLRALNANASAGTTIRKMYAEVIQDLENSYAAHHPIASDRSLVFIWCAIVPEEYVSRVRKRQPIALVILAHFAVLLHSVSAQWWAGDRGRRLTEAIHAELDDKWKPAVRWPMDAVQGSWPP